MIFAFVTQWLPSQVHPPAAPEYVTVTSSCPCKCLITVEGDDSSYGGLVLVVVWKGSVLSRGGHPHVLAVSMDPSAACWGKRIELGRPPECASRQTVWAENPVCSGASDKSHRRLASRKEKCIEPGSSQPG